MFSVVRERVAVRPKLDGGGESSSEWEPVGVPHLRAVDAMRDFIVGMEPGLSSADDATIRRHWPSFKRNQGVKIIRPCRLQTTGNS